MEAMQQKLWIWLKSMDGRLSKPTGTSVTSAQAPKTREDLQALMRPVQERFDPQQEAQNAAVVGFELEVVSTKVDRFGWRDLSDQMKQRLTDDWTDVLRKYPIAEVRRGIGDWLKSNPRKCPNEHDVEACIMARRGAAMQSAVPSPAKDPEEPRERVSPDRAAEILKEMGMTRDRLDGVTRGENDGSL